MQNNKATYADLSKYFIRNSVKLLNMGSKELATEIRILTQKASNKNIHTLVSSNKNIRTLVSSNKNIRTLVSSNKNIRTLVSSNKNINVPVLTNKNIKVPVLINKQTRPPILSNKNIKAPVLINKNIKTHTLLNRNAIIPVIPVIPILLNKTQTALSNQTIRTNQTIEIKIDKLTISLKIPKCNIYQKIAVIVELRSDKFLIEIIKHFMKYLDNTWKIQIFHGLLNKDMIISALKEHILNINATDINKDNRIILCQINKNNLTKIEYSTLLLCRQFWELCFGQHILIFQMDSCINPKSKISIDSFLHWDYIGAPWDPKRLLKSLLNNKKTLTVGNGGFSLRNREVMIAVMDAIDRKYSNFKKECPNEDMLICSVLATKPFAKVKVADIHTAKQFAVEKLYEPHALGIHNPWKHLKPAEIARFKKDYPTIVQLFNKMNGI